MDHVRKASQSAEVRIRVCAKKVGPKAPRRNGGGFDNEETESFGPSHVVLG
jgi:hypothetical protein